MQQSVDQVAVTLAEIKYAQTMNYKCNILVFGIGHDSIFWHRRNSNGRTVFLEHSMSWLQKIKSKWPELEAYHVQYHTVIERDFVRFKNASLWPNLTVVLPDNVKMETWNIFLVDGPTGGHSRDIGRFQSLYMSMILPHAQKSLVVVDDCERIVEHTYASLFLGAENRFLEIKRAKTEYAAANLQCYYRV